MNIVLLEPEIASNTGNIGRTCVATGTRLHLIEPLGFQLTEKNLKRAGMDYWERLDVTRYIDVEDFYAKNPGAEIFMATTKARQSYDEVHYPQDAFLLFGKESGGIPEELLIRDPSHCVRIPMLDKERSLNLANSVAILLYEALRQNHFPRLTSKGELHRLNWE